LIFSSYDLADGFIMQPAAFVRGPAAGAVVLVWILAEPALGAQWVSTEVAKLTAAGAAAGDQLGLAVALDGDLAVIGVPHDGHPGAQDAGSVRLFQSGLGGPGTWEEVAQLVANDANSGDLFGRAVAVSGDTVAVGAENWGIARGCVYLFGRDSGGPGAWGEVVALRASDGNPQDHFGRAVAIRGSTLLVGAPGAGAAYVFELGAGGPGLWAQTRKLSSGAEAFGQAVALSTDSALVGAPLADTGAGLDAGLALVFGRDVGGRGAWGLVTALSPSDAAPGDQFGCAIALDGGTAVVGAWLDDEEKWSAEDEGAAYVFERDQGGRDNWGEVARLGAADAGDYDYFGMSVSVAKDTVAVGAGHDDHAGGVDSGSAYLFERGEGGPDQWGQVAKLTASDAAPDDYLGYAVALWGDTALVGSFADDNAGGAMAGSAYVTRLTELPEVYCTAGVSASGCQAGVSVAGTASATAPSGFDLVAAKVEGAQDGMFFFGTQGRQAAPWGNGTSFRCVVPPVVRTGLLGGVGTKGACDGWFSQDLNAHWQAQPAHNPGPGAVVDAQLWYRDPHSTDNQTTSFSDAVEFLVGP
jgi:hypothetical protein